MSAVIGSHDLADNDDNVEENSPPPNPSLVMNITTENPIDSSTTIESVHKEPLYVADNEILVLKGFKKDQQTVNVVEQDVVDKNEGIYDSRDHKDRSGDCKPQRDVLMQDQGCSEIVEPDVLEGNEEIIVSKKSNREQESNDWQLQLEKDSPVISNKQLSDVVEKDISCGQNENIRDLILNNHEENSNESKLETDTPMESDDNYNDQL